MKNQIYRINFERDIKVEFEIVEFHSHPNSPQKLQVRIHDDSDGVDTLLQIDEIESLDDFIHRATMHIEDDIREKKKKSELVKSFDNQKNKIP